MALRFVMNGISSKSNGKGLTSSLYDRRVLTSPATEFHLKGAYAPGMHELHVHVNGVRYLVDVDYLETGPRTVEFVEPLEAGDIVLFSVMAFSFTSKSMHQEFEAQEGQDTFLLTKPYQVGAHTLEVYQNGLMLRLGDDYVEVDEYKVHFLYPLPEGTKITFKE